jgi:aminopeptidase
MDAKILAKYSQVLLGSGVNLQKGQNLVISGEPVHWDFMVSLAEEAYKMGARFVRVDAEHGRLQKARVDNSAEEHLDYVSSFFTRTLDSYLEEGWARIVIDGKEDPQVLKSVDKQRLAKVNRARSVASKKFMDAVLSGGMSWCIAGAPTAAWAAEVMGGAPSAAKIEEFWKVLIPILRLNSEDPAAEWKKHSQTLKRRAQWLNENRFSAVRFSGPGTNLTVPLSPKARWHAGADKTKSGVDFMPNIPTEEVFSAPDWRGVSGRATCTKPVTIMGTPVDGVWFEFREGKVVEFGASVGEEVLAQFLKMDAGAAQLGEVALVGVDSPIAQSGRIFNSILFDENASCHIALGSAYRSCIDGSASMSEQELKDHGVNDSLVHVDFMIGSDKVSVDGIDAAGRSTRIMECGVFVI